MSASVKQVCCQAARQTIRCHRSPASRLVSSESLQCQNRSFLKATRPFTSTAAPMYPRRRGGPMRGRAPSDREQDEEAQNQEVIEDEPEDTEHIDENEMSSTGHAELEQHRELREMMRIAAWEMPLLASLAKEYKRPSSQEAPLRWRYTTFFGEAHPASRKVVVEFKVSDLANSKSSEGSQQRLEDKHLNKLRKLVGARYNPETDVVKMSCESFETQAQNKRYLGDTIQSLIAEAVDPTKDSFEDIPLDTRHHKFANKMEFPEEWKMTAEKRAELEQKRKTLMLEEAKRVEDNSIVSGMAAIEAKSNLRPERVEEPMMANARQALPQGKGARGQRGQIMGGLPT